jgi:hypothetical protein
VPAQRRREFYSPFVQQLVFVVQARLALARLALARL